MSEESTEPLRLTQHFNREKCSFASCRNGNAIHKMLVSGKAALGFLSFEARLCDKHRHYMNEKGVLVMLDENNRVLAELRKHD